MRRVPGGDYWAFLPNPLPPPIKMASAVELPFADAAFDFAAGFMSFMDIPETERVIAEVRQGLSKFKVPRFTHTLSQWLNLLIDTGFVIERIGEPRPSDETARACPNVQDAQVVAYFLHVRARKPATADVPDQPENADDHPHTRRA